MSADTPEARYEALLAWAQTLPPATGITARIGSHTGYLTVTTTIKTDGSKHVSVRVRNPNRGARSQYRGVTPHHLTDDSFARFQIRGDNGRYVNWTPEEAA